MVVFFSWHGLHFWICILFCKVHHGDSVTKPDYYYYYYYYSVCLHASYGGSTAAVLVDASQKSTICVNFKSKTKIYLKLEFNKGEPQNQAKPRNDGMINLNFITMNARNNWNYWNVISEQKYCISYKYKYVIEYNIIIIIIIILGNAPYKMLHKLKSACPIKKKPLWASASSNVSQKFLDQLSDPSIEQATHSNSWDQQHQRQYNKYINKIDFQALVDQTITLFFFLFIEINVRIGSYLVLCWKTTVTMVLTFSCLHYLNFFSKYHIVFRFTQRLSGACYSFHVF